MEKVFYKDSIKVPKYVICFFCVYRNFLLVKGDLGFKLLKLELKIDLLVKDRVIRLSEKKNCVKNGKNIRSNIAIRSLQSKTKTLINKAFFDVSRRSYKKLKLVGVGYRLSCILFNGIKLLKLNVGFSHSVYYRIPEDIIINVISYNRFIIVGTSSDRVAEISSIIRQLKMPESYKGKGILYEDEEISLKEVKKS